MHDVLDLPTRESRQKHTGSWGFAFLALNVWGITVTFASVISDNVISDVLEATNLSTLVGEYVCLKSHAGHMQGCCPFHEEKTPSFTVYDDHYHCYGCAAHGNAFEFLQNHLGMNFPEAVKMLAARAGIVVEPSPAEDRKRSAERWLIDTNRSAHAVYQRLLYQPENSFALQALRERGIDDDSIARFGIGFAPDCWTTLTGDDAFKEGSLIKAGLAKPRTNRKGSYDVFRGRLMFPVHNRHGYLVGFSGRLIEGAGPKYLNTEETPIYQKGSVLFGLNQAGNAIRKHGRVIVVEGFFDVVTPAQHGFEHILSTCGTALTEAQIGLLLSLANSIVFCFDGDSAGMKATWRAAEMMVEKLADHHEVRLSVLPPEHDPDTLVRAEGVDRFAELIDSAPTLIQYLAKMLAKGCAIPEARARALLKAKSLYKRFASPLLAALFRQHLCELLDFPAEQFDALGETPKTFADPDAATCPFCASTPLMEEASGHWRIICSCGISTKLCCDTESARSIWNHRSTINPHKEKSCDATLVPA